MTNEEIAIEQFLNRKNLPYVSACGCMGPQEDDPLCPCRMEWTEKVGGELYYIEQGETVRNWIAKKINK